MRRLRRSAPWLAAAVLGWSALPSTVRAETATAADSAAKKRVLVAPFGGAKPQSSRDWLMQGLREDGRYEVVEGDGGAAVSTSSTEAEIAAAAREQNADAVVLGRAALGKQGWQAKLAIHDGKDGQLLDTVTVSGATFSKYEAALIAGDELDAPLARAAGQPAAAKVDLEESVEPEVAPPVAPPPPPPSGPLRPSPFQLRIGARLYSRAFRYTDQPAEFDPDAEALAAYTLPAGPMPFAQATWYPAAHFTDGWLSHLGLRGGYELGVATQVNYDGEALQQNHSLWYAGLRGRLPFDLGALGRAELGLLADFANHRFIVEGGPFPDVDYKMVELGADVEWRLDGLIVGGYFQYDIVFDTGGAPGQVQSGDWFPQTKASGVDFGGNVGWELSRVFDILVGIDARAYGMAFNPPPDAEDNRVVGGATDRYLSFWGGLGVHWPEDLPAAPPAAQQPSPAGGDDFDSFD